MSLKNLITDVFEAGVYPDLPEAEKKRIRLLNRLMFLAAGVMLAFGILDLFSGFYEISLMCVVVVIVGYSEQILVKKRYYAVAKHMAFWLMLLTLIFMCLVVGNQAGANYMMVPLCMFPLLIFNSRITAAIHFFFIFGAFILVLFLQKDIQPIIILPQHLLLPYVIMAAFNMMLITYLFTSYARSVNESYEKLILEKTAQLSEAYKDITDSIAYAKHIQDAYLPHEGVLTHYFPESFLLFKPKDIVSGDFYWFYNPRTQADKPGDEVFIAVADCTGHGVPGAIMSVICCNALNEVVVTRGLKNCGEILDEVRNTVIKMLKSNTVSSQKDGMDIALVKINLKNSELEFAGANNPLWIIKNDNQIIEIKADKQPIGMYEGMKSFSSHKVQLNKGDQLFLFSDGYADQFGGPKGKKFKYSNLQKLLVENVASEFQTINLKLQTEFNNWKGDLEQVDDVCIIGIKI